jgi:hypothetical protein
LSASGDLVSQQNLEINLASNSLYVNLQAKQDSFKSNWEQTLQNADLSKVKKLCESSSETNSR